MRCPVCKTSSLTTQPLDENLLTLRCPDCEGHWVKSFQYWKWRETQPVADRLESIGGEETMPATDSRAGKLCPECGHFLTRRPVGHGVAFNLDGCGHCGGMWFDKCEWDILQSRSLHRDAHYIFTETWQAEVREANRIELARARLMKLLGEQDYNELMRVARWVRGHEQRPILMAAIRDPELKLIAEVEN
ncbi:MAG: zf-TFIIB domain-containing protein [Phycisphaerales bacterium]